jgi:hypothetical protein
MTVDHPTSAEPAAADQGTGLGRPLAQSADPIDRVVRLAPTWTVCVLIACGLLVAGTVVWAFVGQVTTSVSARALYSEGGVADVASTKSVSVNQVLVGLGDQVSKGDKLITLQDGSALTSPQDGQVTSVLVSDGSAMWPGKVAVRVTDPNQPDTVIAAFSPQLTGTVVPGLPARMEVSSAPPARFGYLLGTVDEVSADPYTVAQIAETLDMDKEVVTTLLGSEPALLTIIKLEPAATPSGQRWSVGQGPDFMISQGVPLTARVVLSEEPPIQVVFS